MNIYYRGKYAAYQQGKLRLYANVKLNDEQSFLFNRALYGMTVYSPEEVSVMHKEKRKRIIKVNQRCQEILNLWKQELVNEFTNSFLKSYFWHSKVTDWFLNHGTFTDPEFTNTLSFKELGVEKQDIINKLVDEGILPKNFFELKSCNQLITL